MFFDLHGKKIFALGNGEGEAGATPTPCSPTPFSTTLFEFNCSAVLYFGTLTSALNLLLAFF